MTETMIDLPSVIAKSDDADFLRELIQDAAQRLMDIEVAAVCGAGHGERSPDRENHRNGYRPRQWDTRAGTIGLNIPKLRKGSYFPTFLEPRRTADPLPGPRQEPRPALHVVRPRQPVPGAPETDDIRTSLPEKRQPATPAGQKWRSLPPEPVLAPARVLRPQSRRSRAR